MRLWRGNGGGVSVAYVLVKKALSKLDFRQFNLDLGAFLHG